MNSIARNQLTRNLRHLLNSRIVSTSSSKEKSYLSVPDSIDGVRNKRIELMSYYPNIVNEMKDIAKSFDPMGGESHFEHLMDYSVTTGKKHHALMVVHAFDEMVPKVSQTEANLKLSNYLGWCLEMFHGFRLILDDVVDGNHMRRRQPRWYSEEDLPLTAVNDALMLGTAPYEFLKKHFRHLQCYVKLIEVLNTNELTIAIANFMDCRAKYQDVLTFSLEQYKQIVDIKTVHHSFYTPIALANHFIGLNEAIPENSHRILNEMGCFFQIQDDFLDCYGDPAVTGKDGTDIQDGKCTWLVVTFLSLATEVQKAKLKENYGKKDKKAIQCVKELYDEVGLKKVFRNYEETAYEGIKSAIKQSEGLPRKLCLKIMDRLYKREF